MPRHPPRCVQIHNWEPNQLLWFVVMKILNCLGVMWNPKKEKYYSWCQSYKSWKNKIIKDEQYIFEKNAVLQNNGFWSSAMINITYSNKKQLCKRSEQVSRVYGLWSTCWHVYLRGYNICHYLIPLTIWGSDNGPHFITNVI